jgi:type IV pilus biogenesis protein CpaD/CtpE
VATGKEFQMFYPWLPDRPLFRRWLWPACFSLFLAGCASAPLATTDTMLRAERTIARAEQARVGQYAATELGEARQKLQASRSALLLRDEVNAQRYAEQATLDAELALARAELAQANSVNEEMKNSLGILQQEMLRTTEGNQQ